MQKIAAKVPLVSTKVAWRPCSTLVRYQLSRVGIPQYFGPMWRVSLKQPRRVARRTIERRIRAHERTGDVERGIVSLEV